LSYEGDGVFTDKGISTAHERYALNLGTVELGRSSRREYALANLPIEEFTFGLWFDPTKIDVSSIQAKVKLTLTNELGETVLDVAEFLPNWTRSTSSGRVFVYLRGVQTDVHTGQPDHGWGTYFTPHRKGSYRLIFETMDAGQNARIEAKLVAIGGGWK
jgi:hypothetical protein